MTPQQAVTVAKDRIARVESDRDARRAAGLQEKYIEAYGLVEALGRQLDELLSQSRA